MSTTFSAAKRLATVGLIAATLGLAAPVMAEPAAAPNPALIDTTKTDASLTLFKRLNPAERHTPTGFIDNKVTGTALQGVTFRIEKLSYDLGTAAGMREASAATPATATKDDTFTAQDKVTDDKGMAAFTNLPVGAYLVTETDAPAGVVKSEPFIAFVPMTDPEGRQSWNYNVVAYPKNTQQTLTKTLGADRKEANEVANVGDDIDFDITVSRPAIDPRRSYVSFFQIYDKIPTGLTFKAVPTVKIVDPDGETTVLTADTDYTVKGDAPYARVTLTREGNDKLTKADYDANVVATFTFTVTNEVANPLTVHNMGGLVQETKDRPTPTDPDQPIPDVPDTNNPDPENPPKNPEDPSNPTTPETTDTFIPIVIDKQGLDANTKLAGAKFNVYRCTKTGEEKAVLDGDKLTVDGKAEFETDSNGAVTINALRVRANRTEDMGYCLVETTAPKGYELLTEPVFFQLDKAKPNEVKNLPVTNIPANGPKLPATGGMGIAVLMGSGAVMGLIGAAWLRRKRNAEN